jgi:hypothetical protein
MARLIITSRMRGFQLIRRITDVSDRHMRADATIAQWPLYTGLEVMAQLAALHVRCSLSFERHAFLLKVERCDLPPLETLNGRFRLTAERLGQSSQSFAYGVTALGPDDLALEARLLIGTLDYDGRFKKERLKQHYRNLFKALSNGSTRSFLAD